MAARGEVWSGYVGWDVRTQGGAVGGVAVSHHEGELGFEGQEARARVTGVVPYGRWTGGGGVSVWALAGAGRGEVRWEEGETGRTGLGMRLVAAGWRKEWDGPRALRWAVKGDGFAVQMHSEASARLPAVRAGAQRLRLVLESAAEWSVGAHGRVDTRVEFGGRWDGGEAGRGYGSEVGGAVHYVNPRLGLGLEGRGRYLLGHESQGWRAWGASLTVRYDPGGDGEGVWLGVSPQWGTPAGGVEALWARAASGDGQAPALRMGVTAGYRRADALDVSLTLGQDKAHGASSSSLGMTFRTHMRW